MSDTLDHHALLRAFQESKVLETETVKLKRVLENKRWGKSELIAEGGAKIIYLTTDMVSGRKVVKAYPRTEEQHEEFLKEAKLLSLLEHSNIIPIHDIGIEDEVPYFVMKYLEGGDLENYVKAHDAQRNSPRFQNEMLDAFLKVCDAVAYAHSLNICHLDLKPANIQIGSPREIFVGDWGLARVAGLDQPDLEEEAPPAAAKIQQHGQFTRYGYLRGTPGFMAPEQCIKGEIKDARTDIYSLGSLLVFLFCGQPPVQGSPDEILKKTQSGKTSFSVEDIPIGLRGVIDKALAVIPDKRYDTVAHLIDDINAFRQGYLTSVANRTTLQLAQALYYRNKRTVLASCLAILIFLGATFLFISALQDSESVALAAKETAIQSEHQAATALHKLERTQHESEALVSRFVKDYVNNSQAFYMNSRKGETEYSTYDDERGYQMASTALQLDPSNQKAWVVKGRLAMLTHRLPEAIDAFSKAGPGFSHHIAACKAFEHQDLKQVKVMVPFLRKLIASEDLRLVHDFMFQVIFTSKPLDEQIYFAEETLNMKTPLRAARLHFDFDAKHMALDISDNKEMWTIFTLKNVPLRELDASYTIIEKDFRHLRNMPLVKLNVAYSKMSNRELRAIRGRPIRSLNLEGCRQVDSLEALQDMPLRSLNIRYLNLKDMSPLKHITTLEEVDCDSSQVEALQRVIDSNRVKLHILKKND